MSLSLHVEKLSIFMLLIGEAFVAYQLALLTWFMLSPPLSVLVWNAPVATQQQTKRIQTQALQSAYLFGQKKIAPSKVKVVQKGRTTPAPKTTLKLTLVGVVAASDPTYSSAIISYQGQQDSYFIDSKIANNQALLIEVYSDRVILNVQGSRETLMLDGAQDEFDNSASSSNSPASSIKTLNIDKKMLLNNPQAILDYINIYPVKEAGILQGYRLSPGRNPTLFNSVGLQAGDIAVQLNGIDLTDRQQSFALMKSFATMTEINLSVKRQGQLQDIYFAIPQ
ncbi:hypothetical protein JI57_03215 [Psychromonas sp. PRT-SC03]|nr:hypothetical protein JI57_03215 [Psychromonas sp. PRT-SC03]